MITRPTSRRRLLLAVHSAKPAGAQMVALGQARTLARHHDIITSIGTGPLRAGFAEIGPVVRGPTRLPIWGDTPARWTLDTGRAVPDALRLAAIIRKHRIDAVIASSAVLVSPILAARVTGVPAMVQVQEAPKSRPARAIFAFQGAFAHTIIAISPWIASAFEGARANVLLNPVGIAIPDLPERATRPADRPLNLVVVGTVDRHKRQDLAVSALADLRASGVDAELTLVGPESDPRYAHEVRAAAASAGVADLVTFAGQSNDVASHLRRADVMLLPAGEVTPLVLMEAMALGTPVVAARMGSIPDVVVEGSGLLVDPDDPAALADATRRIVESPELAASLAAAGRRHVETAFDERCSHARLLEEIDSLPAPRRVAVK